MSDIRAERPDFLIKFATVAPDGSIWMKYMRGLDQEIRKKSNGRLGFVFYTGGIVGDEVDILKKMRIGQIHCAAFSGVGLGHILPMVRVLDLPFLFRDNAEVDKVHNEMQPFFKEKFRKKGYEFLAWAEVGNVHFFSKKPINSVKDLAGLRIWTWSGDPIAKETFSVMGVNPIPLAVTDVTTAISTGMIDTIYAPPLAALPLQWHNKMNYVMALPIVHSTGGVLISSRVQKKMPNELISMLHSSFSFFMRELTLKLREQNQETFEIIEESGLDIIPIPSGNILGDYFNIHNEVAQNLIGKVYSKEDLDRVYHLLNRK